MESTQAVPRSIGHLARAHTDVTLMFMDICGFTAMSKVMCDHGCRITVTCRAAHRDWNLQNIMADNVRQTR